MAKTNITKPTGMESLNIISAFKVEDNIYIVFDSEKMGSMGLPIIYVSKYTTKLEKITDENEWQSVKNYLKGIISGTNFEYVKVGDNLVADEAYYTPLTLPQNSFDAIKTRYVVVEENLEGNSRVLTPETSAQATTPVMPNANNLSNASVNVTPIEPMTPQATSTNEVNKEPVRNPINETTAQGINLNQPIENNPISSVAPIPTMTPNTEQMVNSPINQTAIPTSSSMNFDNDKETFLKACENMFDALISKYQKELNLLEQKEQELLRKEAEINAKMASASEHLKNAEAKEQVANIAHDNAQRVMDLNNFMPVNPNNNTGN